MAGFGVTIEAWTLGQASRQKIEREFSLGAVIDQYEKLYRETFAAVGN